MRQSAKGFTFAEKLGLEGFNGIALYHGADAFGTAYICYIKCDKQDFEKMKQDYLHKIVAHPDSYGEIIYKDWISKPDKKAEEFLHKWLKDNK